MRDLRIRLINNLSDKIELTISDGKTYIIEADQLGEVLEHNVSSCISRLSGKEWMNDFSLYQIGSLISQTPRTKNIDWETTYYPIEHRNLSAESNLLDVDLEDEIRREVAKNLLLFDFRLNCDC